MSQKRTNDLEDANEKVSYKFTNYNVKFNNCHYYMVCCYEYD